jgi:hypothetical protein
MITRVFQNRVVDSVRTKTSDDQFVIPAWAVVAAEDYWVDELSAGLNIPDDRRKDVRGSHRRIVKPKNRYEPAYEWVVEKIIGCLTQHAGANGEAEKSLKKLLKQYPPPRISEEDPYNVSGSAVDPYDVLGISKTRHVDRFREERSEEPPYIPRRKADKTLDEALKTSRFVIVTGRSKSGKTRTAFEAAKRNLPGYQVIVPAKTNDPDLLRDVIEAYEKIPAKFLHSVLWLDDIERYLKAGVLNITLVNQLLECHKSLVIFGTLRSKEFAELDRAKSEIGRSAKETLRKATEVFLEDKLEPEEQHIARELYHALYPKLVLIFQLVKPLWRHRS